MRLDRQGNQLRRGLNGNNTGAQAWVHARLVAHKRPPRHPLQDRYTLSTHGPLVCPLHPLRLRINGYRRKCVASPWNHWPTTLSCAVVRRCLGDTTLLLNLGKPCAAMPASQLTSNIRQRSYRQATVGGSPTSIAEASQEN